MCSVKHICAYVHVTPHVACLHMKSFVRWIFHYFLKCWIWLRPLWAWWVEWTVKSTWRRWRHATERDISRKLDAELATFARLDECVSLKQNKAFMWRREQEREWGRERGWPMAGASGLSCLYKQALIFLSGPATFAIYSPLCGRAQRGREILLQSTHPWGKCENRFQQQKTLCVPYLGQRPCHEQPLNEKLHAKMCYYGSHLHGPLAAWTLGPRHAWMAHQHKAGFSSQGDMAGHQRQVYKLQGHWKLHTASLFACFAKWDSCLTL